jgi:hypothetical protein
MGGTRGTVEREARYINCLIGKLERMGPLEFVCVNRRIILKTVLQKYDGSS